MNTPEFSQQNNVETHRSKLLTDAIQAVINTANTRVNGKGELGLSKNRIASYASFKKIVEDYQIKSKEIYSVKNVNVAFANNFLNFLLNEKDYSKSYALKKIADLKTVCRTAKLEGLETDVQLNSIKSPKGKKQNIIFLNPSELQKIKNTTLTDPELQNARKWLLLGCNIGQRAGDLLNLDENNFTIRNGIEVIELIQEKTAQQIIIPNHTCIKEIVKDKFPYKIPIQKLNTHIKEICQLAKIDNIIKGILFNENSKRRTEGNYEKYKLITSHVCRRSYAMNNYGNISTPLLKKITGHTTDAILLSYIGKDSLINNQQTYSLF